MSKNNTSTETSKPGPAQQTWQNSHLLVGSAIIFVFISLLIGFGNLGTLVPSGMSQIKTECGHPLKIVQDWHIRTFHPKWFGLFGDPGTITYRTWSSKARQVSVVDIDRRDIEIRLWVDREDRGHNPVELDHTVECGEDVKKCIDLGFGAARILVPPGWHKVTAEIVKRKSDTFDWGGERKKRVMWNVQECP